MTGNRQPFGEVLRVYASAPRRRTLVVLGGAMESRPWSGELNDLLARFTFTMRESAPEFGDEVARLLSRLAFGAA